MICPFVIGLFGSGLVPVAVNAQTSLEMWSVPLKLSASNGFLSSPRLLVSPDGNLHAFWIENKQSDPSRSGGFPEAIVHTYSVGGRWSKPHDILVAPSAQRIGGFSVFLDEWSQAYVFLQDYTDSRLYYSTADLAAVDFAHGWSRFQRVSAERVVTAGARLFRGTLYVVYTQQEKPSEINLIKSNDYGATWSAPVRISNAAEFEEAAMDATLGCDSDGTLHIVWAQYRLPNWYPPTRIMYARSLDDGQTWSVPVQLQEGNYGAPALVIGSKGQLFLEYNGASGTHGRYFLNSTDGGKTWSKRVTIAPGVGGLTGGSLALDSADVLHFVSASGEPGGIDGIAYSQWNGKQWSPLLNIARTTAPYTTEERRQGFEPTLLITEGNQLHVIYLGRGHTDVFYVTARAQAPRVPMPTALPTRTPAPTAQPTLTASPTARFMVTPSPLIKSGEITEISETNSFTPFLVSAIPVVLLVAVIVIVRLGRLGS